MKVVVGEAASECKMFDLRWNAVFDCVKAVTHWTAARSSKTTRLDNIIGTCVGYKRNCFRDILNLSFQVPSVEGVEHYDRSSIAACCSAFACCFRLSSCVVSSTYILVGLVLLIQKKRLILSAQNRKCDQGGIFSKFTAVSDPKRESCKWLDSNKRYFPLILVICTW